MDKVPLTQDMGEGPCELVCLTGFEAADSYDLDAERRFGTIICAAQGGKFGGTGSLREAYTTGFEHVALKVMNLPNSLMFSEDEYERELGLRRAAFREEYETLLKLRVMRAFPTVYGYGELDGAPAIVMEWIEGTPLKELKGSLTKEGVAALARATYLLLEQVENQLAAFVHRDIAPGNIIVRTSNRTIAEQLESGHIDLCLVDLGSTTVARETGESFTVRVGAVRGATPAYAAPELLSLEMPAELRNNPKVDVYAAASVMWELLTGVVPYAETSPDLLLRAKREAAPDVPEGLDEDAARLARILAKGVDPIQATRPTSHDMRVWLDDLIAGKPGFWDGKDASKPLLTRRNLLIGAGFAAAAAGIAIIAPRISDMLGKDGQPFDEADNKQSGLEYYTPTVSLDTYKGPLLPCLSESGTWGYCTTDAEWAIQADYDEVSYFSAGLAVVKHKLSKLYGFIDTLGNEVIEPQFLDVRPFGRNSLAPALSENGSWGYIDRFGNWAIEPAYADAGEFTEIAPVQDPDSGLWGFIDESGEWLVNSVSGTAGAHYASAGAYRNGLAPVRMSNNIWMYVRADGSVVDNQVFSHADEFFEGYARVVTEHSNGPSYFVDAMFGKYGSNDYIEVGRVSQGMFAVRHNNGGWGFGEVSSWRVTIKPVYFKVGRFVQGLALVCDLSSRRWGYIDMFGNWVVEPIMSSVTTRLTSGGSYTA